MAAVTPAVKGQTGYCPPGYIFMNHLNVAPDTVASGKLIPAYALRHEVYTLTDADDADLWTPPVGTVAVAKQDVDLGGIGANTLNGNGRHRVAGAVNTIMFVHVWRGRSSKYAGTGTNEPPVTKGTAGYHSPRCGRRNDDGFTFAKGTTPQFLGARHMAFYFADVSTGDIWSIRAGGRIIMSAWQASGTADVGDGFPRVMFLASDVDGVEFVAAANSNGWLHCWFKG